MTMSNDTYHAETVQDDRTADRNDVPARQATKRSLEECLPSSMSQIFTVFRMQMKLFFKNKMTFVLMFLALLIPILVFTGTADDILDTTLGVEGSISYILVLMPLMMAALPAMASGRTMSAEFRDRTVYFNFPLPISRKAFYIGKFIASAALSVGLIMLGFGLAVVSGSSVYGISYPYDLIGAFVILLFGTIAISATAFGLSPFFKRGSIALTIVLTLFIPFVFFIVSLVTVGNVDETFEGIWGILRLIPPFASYHAMYIIDNGFMTIMFGDFIWFMMGGDGSALAYAGVSVIWAALFLLLGMSRVIKKEL